MTQNNQNQTETEVSLSRSSSLKTDEGYSDETKSVSDLDSKSVGNLVAIPDWIVARTEEDRAGEVHSKLSPNPYIYYQFLCLLL